MSEFSDRPFVAGTITGLRAFRIDALGRLTGVTYKDVWTPGENAAACHVGALDVYGAQIAQLMAAQTLITRTAFEDAIQGRGFDRKGKKRRTIPATPTPAEKAAAVTNRPAHTLAGVGCQCGFYAYFDGGNDYLVDTAMTITNGGQFSHGGYIIGNGQPDNAPRVAAIVNGWGTVTAGTRGFRAEKAQVVALIAPSSQRARHEVAFSKVRHNYPNVQVFETEREAVQAFPLSDPMPTPETADDFWTRSAS